MAEKAERSQITIGVAEVEALLRKHVHNLEDAALLIAPSKERK